MNVFDLLDIPLPPATHATSGGDAQVMSGWKFWFPDETSSTGDCSFDIGEYDIEACSKTTPSVVSKIDNDESSSIQLGLSSDSAESSPSVSSMNVTNQSASGMSTSTVKKPTSRMVYACAICTRAFTSEKYLSMHLALHRKSPQALILPVLGSVNGTSPTKKATVTQRSSVGVVSRTKWTCEVCFKSFAQNSNYKNHIRTHSDERPFVCHVCSIGFKERYHLKKHTLFKHTGELNEACRQCGKRFKDSTAVRAHERIHSELRPYSCQRCGKAFKTSECLWHHDHRSKTCGRTRHMSCSQTTHTVNGSSKCQPPPPATSTVSMMTLSAGVDGSRFPAATVPTTFQHPVQQPAELHSVPPALTVPPSSIQPTSISPSFNAVNQTSIKQETGIPPTCVVTVKVENPLPTTQHCYFQQYIATVNHNQGLSVPPDNKLSVSSSSATVSHPLHRDSATGLFTWTQPTTNKPVAVVVGQHMTSSPCVTMTTTTTNSGGKQRAVCSRCGKQFASPLAFERHLAVHSETRPYRCQLCDVGFKLKVHLKKHNLYRHNTDYPCRCGVCGKPFKDSSAVRLHERIHSTARPFQCACGKSFKTRENLWGHRHRRPCVGLDSNETTVRAACHDVSSAGPHPPVSGRPSTTNICFKKPLTTASQEKNGDGTRTTSATAAASSTNVAHNSSDIGARTATISLSNGESIKLQDATCYQTEANGLPSFDAGYNSLPPFETLVPQNQIPVPSTAKVQTVSIVPIPVSIDDVIFRSTSANSSTVKLPCIEQLFDRTTWQSANTMTSSQCESANCMTSDDSSRYVPVACWDADALWLDHKMAVIN